MDNGFGIDGKLFRGLTKAGDFLILGFLTVIFSIPIITAGGAITAGFYAGTKLVKDEENYVFKDFWKSFKQNFLQGFLTELILSVVAGILVMDLKAAQYWLKSSGSTVALIFIYVIFGVMMILGAEIVYAFAMLSRYENKVVTNIKNALLVLVHHLPQTFIIMIITYGLIYFSSIYWTAFIVTIPLILYGDSFILVRIFKQLEKGNTETMAEEEANVEDEAEVEDEANVESETEVEDEANADSEA